MKRGRVARAVFLPEEVAQVKAIACELPKEQGVPLSRFSRSELHRFVVERGVSEASASTIGRWLAEDAIRPCTPPSPGGGQLVEDEYERMGAVTYPDAWDVHEGKIMGRTEPKGAIAPFDRLVHQVMTNEPYASARRVFWIVDNGSDHRGEASVKRLQSRWQNLILVHLSVHGSWLNQVEIYHSIIQRKVLRPNDFNNTDEVAQSLSAFEERYNQIARPFEWNFTHQSSPNSSTDSKNPSARLRSRSPPKRSGTYGGQH